MADLEANRQLEERSLVFAVAVLRFVATFPRTDAGSVVTRQLTKSGTSIGANYREANDALSKKDFGHRIKIARKEAKEAGYWLQLLEEAQPGLDGEIFELRGEAGQLRKILSSIAEKSDGH